MTPPNVLLILTDDQGYGDVGYFGNPHVCTPHVDALAADGVALTQHYSGSPLCAPARAALLTGCYNHRVGAISVESNRGLDRITLSQPTIADRFRAAGYATGLVGKWHNGVFDGRYHPCARGFDEFTGFRNGGMGYWDWIIEQGESVVRSDGRYLTDVFTDAAVDFIGRHAKEPFFLTVAYNAPHEPMEAPEEDVQPFRETGAFTETVSTLYGMLRRMDAGIGRLLETLDALGLRQDTIVLFTSDNGPWLAGDFGRDNGPFRGQKQDVLEGGIRVPAIVRWPDGLPSGATLHEMVHFVDWLPTLAVAAGVEVLDDRPLDGVDALATLRGEAGTEAKRFWQYNRYDPVPSCNAAMRDGPWKLVWPRIPEAMQKLPEDNVWYRRLFTEAPFDTVIENALIERQLSAPGIPSLFNIADDPGESQDLATQHPDRVTRMRVELEGWFEEVEAQRTALSD